MRWVRWVLLLLSLTVLILLPGPRPAVSEANGGQIRVAGERLGPYDVTVFTSPTPLQVATADVSTMVQPAGGSDFVLDARVWVTAEPVNPAGHGKTYEATHAQATNKLFYAANFKLPTAGAWRFTVKVVGPAGQGETNFDAQVTKFGVFRLPTSGGMFFGWSWPVGLLVILVIGVGLWWFFWGSGDGVEKEVDQSADVEESSGKSRGNDEPG